MGFTTDEGNHLESRPLFGHARQVTCRAAGRPPIATSGRAAVFLCVFIIEVFAGCGKSTTTAQNAPPPATSSVSIAFHPRPAGSVSLASPTPIVALVSNDPSKAGVDWALLCQNQTNCGSLSPLHTASGAPTVYAPPPSISGNIQPITIQAFATADHSKNVNTAIMVTGFASNLKGTYVFQTKGLDINGPFQLAGVIVLDGNGGIAAGKQTHSDAMLSVTDAITGGSYYIGPDGRGTLSINTADQLIGQLGVENLSLVFISGSQALIAILDNPNLQPSVETASGTLDLQTSATAPSGGYAFAMSGADISFFPMALGGILRIDSPGTISGTGSVADLDDAGVTTLGAALSGTLTSPDSFGSLMFTLTTPFSTTPLEFTGYIVDAAHIKLVESDVNGSGAGFGAAGGVAIAQGTATGSFTNGSFAGNYVFDVLGEDLSQFPTSFASLGQLSADSSGNLSGYDDEILNGSLVGTSDSFTGTYTLDAQGIGRVDSTIAFSTRAPAPEWIFYLTGNGNPPLVLNVDVPRGSLGVGAANLQAAPPFSINGNYGLAFTQGNGTENDATGQVTANGQSGTLTGIVDTTSGFAGSGFSPNPNTPITGTFASIPGNGRSTGTLNNTFFPFSTNNTNTIGVAYYVVDSAHLFFIETDSLSIGIMSLGYLAARTPVCPTCP